MITKVCSTCEEDLIIDNFHKSKKGKHGVTSTCKPCKAKKDRERHGSVKVKKGRLLNTETHKWCYACEKVLPRASFGKSSACRSCRSNHYYKERAKPFTELKQKGKRLNTETHKWCPSCSQLLLRQDNFYKHKHSKDGLRSECKSCHSKREIKRRNKDPNYKLRTNVSRAIRGMLAGKQKSGSCLSHLPYSFQQLREHLESQFDDQMSWENYGSYWDVDHIYPHSLLPYDSMEHPNFAKCWALENLQPLEKIENIKKSNKVFDEPLT